MYDEKVCSPTSSIAKNIRGTRTRYYHFKWYRHCNLDEKRSMENVPAPCFHLDKCGIEIHCNF